MQHATGSSPATRPPLTRRSQHKIVAGVAGGLGDHFHIEPNLVRLAFVVLTLAGGAGAVLYAAGWLFLPTDGGEDGGKRGGSVTYRNCDAVRAAGKAPLHRGAPGYSRRLDRDGDGVACGR